MMAALKLLWAGSFAPPQPIRAAVLNTGELVLLDGSDRAQVFSPETTDLLRDVLDHRALFDSLPLPPPGANAGTRIAECGLHDCAGDPVHDVIRKAAR